MMSSISPQWKKTKDLYINWLINTELRKLFSKIYITKTSPCGGLLKYMKKMH